MWHLERHLHLTKNAIWINYVHNEKTYVSTV